MDSCATTARKKPPAAHVYEGVIDFKEKLRRFVRPHGVDLIHAMQKAAGQPCQEFPQKLK